MTNGAKAPIEGKMNQTQKALRNLSLRVKKTEDVCALVRQGPAGKALSKIEDRINFLSDRLQLEVLKNSVMTEVLRAYPQCRVKLLEAMDEDAAWWKLRESLSLRQWRDFLTKVYPGVKRG